MSTVTVAVGKQNSLDVKKKTSNSTGPNDSKKKVRAVKSSVGKATDHTKTSVTQSGSGSRQDLGKSPRTKQGFKTDEIRKKTADLNGNAVTPENGINGPVGKITKKLKKKVSEREVNAKEASSNIDGQENSELFGNSEAKETLKKVKKVEKVKKVVKKKSSVEGEGSGKTNGNVGNDVGDTTLKSMLKKKGTGKANASSESKTKKSRGTKTTFKLLSQEFEANKNIWTDENSPDPSLNTMFPNVPNVKADAQAYRTKVDLAGYSNDNISLDLNGRRLVVVAYRLAGKTTNARKITEVVDIPINVDLDTLNISRRSDGSLVIEEIIPSLEQQIPV